MATSLPRQFGNLGTRVGRQQKSFLSELNGQALLPDLGKFISAISLCQDDERMLVTALKDCVRQFMSTKVFDSSPTTNFKKRSFVMTNRPIHMISDDVLVQIFRFIDSVYEMAHNTTVSKRFYGMFLSSHDQQFLLFLAFCLI